MTDDDALKQALAELGDVVRCRCHEAYRDRDLQDPECQCDSMDAVRVVIARIEWLERERVLDAKLLADTQALLDKAVVALRRIADAADRKHVGDIARAVLAEIEGRRMSDDLVKRLRDFDPHNMHEWEAVDLAADRIEQLVQEKREAALDALAAHGQAHDAYEAQLKAEATVASLKEQVEAMRGAIEYVLDGYGLNAPDYKTIPGEHDEPDWIVEKLRAALTTENQTNG